MARRQRWTSPRRGRRHIDNPSDGSGPVLSLDAIRRTRHVGGTATVPEVNFGGERRPNRVDGIENPPLQPAVAAVRSTARDPGPVAREKGLVGGIVDASTGLTHLGAREYDPSLGRFISVDPIMDLADPQQMHGYAYANNNPTTFSDPTGLKIADCEATHASCKTGGPLQQPGPGAHHGTDEQQANHNKTKNDAGKGKSGSKTSGPGHWVDGKGTSSVWIPDRISPILLPPPRDWTDGCAVDEGALMAGVTTCTGGGGGDPHLGLDVCGMAPVVGEPCDAANAIWYTLEGDHINAGMSILGIIPILGWFVTGARWSGKAASEADEAADAASGASKSVRGPWQLTREGASATKRGGPFNTTFYESKSDGTWWTPDKAGHGGSAFKVYRETSKGLEWVADANQYGDYIVVGKSKSEVEYVIPWSMLGSG